MNGSHFQSRGFTLDYYDRLVRGGQWLGSLNLSVQSWRHTIAAFGGFDTAEFTLMESQAALDDWAVNGLGRKIVVSDENLTPMWEGFVDSIILTKGGLSFTYGPLSDIANKIFSIYSGVDTTVFPPVIGARKRSPTFNDVLSQSEWGIWPYILSLAGVSDSNADLLVAMYMSEHRHAEKTTSFSFGGGENSLTVKCIGWYQILRYPYNYGISSPALTTITTRLQEIITAQPNPEWLSSDFSNLQDNATPIIAYQSDDQLAIEQIKGYTAMGDATNNRWLFGVYEDRKAYHYPVLNQIDYFIYLNDPEQGVYDRNTALVPAWRLRPGRWAFFADFMPGMGIPDLDHLDEDPRTILIENTNFDVRVPIEFQITGGHNSSYEQKSAKLGLRGVSV